MDFGWFGSNCFVCGLLVLLCFGGWLIAVVDRLLLVAITVWVFDGLR